MHREDTSALVLLLLTGAVGAVLAVMLTGSLDLEPTRREITSLALSKAHTSPMHIEKADFLPPRVLDAPLSIRDEVTSGYLIFTQTAAQAPDFVGNELSCSSCHFRGGTTHGGRNGGISLVGVAARHPVSDTSPGSPGRLAAMVDRCFVENLNGRPLPPGSGKAAELESYLRWISRGIPDYADAPWLGVKYLDTAHVPDPGAGKKHFARDCSMCHGLDGAGTAIAPAVWGDGSFGTDSGMNDVYRLAAFVHANMPRENPLLTPDEALDVASFVSSQPRPTPGNR